VGTHSTLVTKQNHRNTALEAKNCIRTLIPKPSGAKLKLAVDVRGRDGMRSPRPHCPMRLEAARQNIDSSLNRLSLDSRKIAPVSWAASPPLIYSTFQRCKRAAITEGVHISPYNVPEAWSYRTGVTRSRDRRNRRGTAPYEFYAR